MNNAILIVDDDQSIRELVRFHVIREGYQAYEAADGMEASELLSKHSIQLAIVDVMMPGKNGWELCQEIREDYNIPIILLTARGELSDKEKGFSLGTDDYVVKPFEIRELLFRIKALMRRYQLQSNAVIRLNETVIDRNSYVVKAAGSSMQLPLKEFELLSQLAQFPGRIFTRDELLQIIWGSDFEGDARTIDVHIKRLRERFADRADDFVITTVRGLGYKLEVSES